jgi:hypothetical protein
MRYRLKKEKKRKKRTSAVFKSCSSQVPFIVWPSFANQRPIATPTPTFSRTFLQKVSS